MPEPIRKTNQRLVTEMMQFSRYGSMAETFIMAAILNEAERISNTDPGKLTGAPNPQLWVSVAAEVRDKLYEHLGLAQPQPLAAAGGES